MAKELEAIDITNEPELLRIAEAVQASGTPRLLRRNQEDVALVVPTTSKPAKLPRRSSRPVTLDDPLFALFGTGHSGIPGGMSDRKHEALTRAYRP